MPTLTLDAYASYYQERADLSFDWTEENVNAYGATSHSIKAGRGVQYDPSGAAQFVVYGFRGPEGGSEDLALRVYKEFIHEGPHETTIVLVFQLPLAQNTQCTNAQLRVKYLEENQAHPLRCWGIALDNYITRNLSNYPLTYRSEFHPNAWGRARRYRAESLDYEMPHTEAIVRWQHEGGGTPQSLVTFAANLAPIVNEILARPGWRSGNRMCLTLALDYPSQIVPYAPDPYGVITPGHYNMRVQSAMSNVPPQLIFSY